MARRCQCLRPPREGVGGQSGRTVRDVESVARVSVRTKLLVLLACVVSAACAASTAHAAFTPTLATSTQEMTTTFNTSVAVEIKVPRDHDALLGGDLYAHVDTSSPPPTSLRAHPRSGERAVRSTRDRSDSASIRRDGRREPCELHYRPLRPWTPCGGVDAAAGGRRAFLLQLYMDETVGAARELGDYVIRFCIRSREKLLSLQVNFRGHFRARALRQVRGSSRRPARARRTRTQRSKRVPRSRPRSAPAAHIGDAAEPHRQRNAHGLGRPVVGQAVLVRVGARGRVVQTSRAGTFRTTVAFGKRRAVVVWATAFVRTRDVGSCPPPSPARQGCVSMTRAYYTINSRFVRVRIPGRPPP